LIAALGVLGAPDLPGALIPSGAGDHDALLLSIAFRVLPCAAAKEGIAGIGAGTGTGNAERAYAGGMGRAVIGDPACIRA
jgi:hypothetical protein